MLTDERRAQFQQLAAESLSDRLPPAARLAGAILETLLSIDSRLEVRAVAADEPVKPAKTK